MSICLFRFAIQESKKIPIIVHPLKTSSCGMFSNEERKHGVRSAVIELARFACEECFRSKRDDNFANVILKNIPHEEAFIGNMIF